MNELKDWKPMTIERNSKGLYETEKELTPMLDWYKDWYQGPEKDPHGKSAHETGAKLDHGKTRLGLVLGGFPRALQAVGEVGTFGAKKYTDRGWLDVPNGQQRYTDAMLRHLMQEFKGELIDPETNLIHAAQTAWNALARLELLLKELEQ